MDELEQKIKDELIRQRADEIYQDMQDPKYLEEVRNASVESAKKTSELVFSLIDGLFGLMGKAEDDEYMPPDIKEKLDSLKSRVSEKKDGVDFAKQAEEFSRPENMKKYAQEQAKAQYMTREDLDLLIKEQDDKLKELGPDVAEEFKDVDKVIYALTAGNDEFIKRLSEYAGAKGFEEALKKETQYSILRFMYPTADDYIANQLKSIDVMKSFISKASDMVVGDDELSPMFSSLIGDLESGIDKINQAKEKILVDRIYKDIEKIYTN